MATRLTTASVDTTCHNMGNTPPSTELLDTIHSTGTVTPIQADQPKKFIDSLGDNTYPINKTLLLLKATGHAKPDSLKKPPSGKEAPKLRTR